MVKSDLEQTALVKDSSLRDLLRSGLDKTLEAALRDYLPRQRWFGAKSRHIDSVYIASLLSLENAESAIALLDIIYEDGGRDAYQLPLAIARGSAAAQMRDAQSKAVLQAEIDGDRVVFFDASVDGGFQQALASLFTTSSNDLPASHSPLLQPQSLLDLATRVSSAEQSNTSIFIGDRAILKLFRRLEPGVNPEVEMTRFLTDVAHFKHIPAYFGEIHSRDHTTLAVLQAFAANQGDGWAWFEKQLQRFLTQAPANAGDTASVLHGAQESLDAATLLGTRTAEMHIALATPTDDPAFQAEEVSHASLSAEEERIRGQVEQGLYALEHALATLPERFQAKAKLLLSRRESLIARCEFSSLLRKQAHGKRIRIHGDYHLGQTLRTEDDFLIVDFEGEPAQPLEHRRMKQSPLKDVSGMLRSFSYAASSALAACNDAELTDAATVSAWSDGWRDAASQRFLEAYWKHIQSCPNLIPEADEARHWLTALLLEKSAYELLYELNNRPSWVYIPLEGMLALTS